MQLCSRHCVVLPSHFNVVETYAGCVTNVASILALGRLCDVLHGLSMTFDVHQDFAVCTVMKQWVSFLMFSCCSLKRELSGTHMLMGGIFISGIGSRISCWCCNVWMFTGAQPRLKSWGGPMFGSRHGCLCPVLGHRPGWEWVWEWVAPSRYGGMTPENLGKLRCCRSSAGQGKFAGLRPTFYHCAVQPTVHWILWWRSVWTNEWKDRWTDQNIMPSPMLSDGKDIKIIKKRNSCRNQWAWNIWSKSRSIRATAVMCMCVFYRMKMTLAEFLSSHSIDIRWCYLLLLQLVEAVVHLTKYNISCRYTVLPVLTFVMKIHVSKMWLMSAT